jgi:hypothetical protein
MARLRFFSVLVLFSLASLARADEKSLTTLVDSSLQEGWKREKLTPSAKSSDGEFLRRIYIDLVGVIPSFEETEAFLKDTDSNKRTKWIDKLIADERFSRQQADFWDLVLFGRNPQNGEATRKRDGFKKWLTDQFAKNQPLDQISKRLLLAEEEGSELFHVQYRNQPEEATVAVTRIFLGLQLQCARCHDHPFEAWTQKDFYGMAGFFVRVVVVDGGGTPMMKKFKVGEKSVGEVLFTGAVKDQKPGQKGEPVRPRFLGGDELVEPAPPKDAKKEDLKDNKLPAKPAFSRKEKIAEWVTASTNPYFARALANRIWSQYMGRGFVHPVDDLGGKNAPSHPQLLDALTKHLVDTKFDVKSIVRAIVNSDAYQLSSIGPNKNALPEWYERARVRPMSAEELWASFKVATQTSAESMKTVGEPTEYLVRFFGEPTDGLGNFQGSLAEHLFLNNATHLRQLAQARKGNLGDVLSTMKGTPEEKVNRLFLSMLNRSPSDSERVRFMKHLNGDAKMAPVLLEEAIWSLMCCSEFRFNH